MSSAIKTRASARLAQSFTPTPPKIIPSAIIGVRRLSITGPREASPISKNTFESTMASIPKRSDISLNGQIYNTSRTMKQVNDNSTVDFAYIPAISFTHAINSEYSRIPLLPDNHLFKHHDTSPEPHIGKAEISTATYTDVVSSLSEMDVSKASDSMGMDQALTKDSVVKRVWNDLLDDILGSKQSTSTAST